MDVSAPETQAVIARIVDRLTNAAASEDQRAQEARIRNATWEGLHYEGRVAGIRYALAELALAELWLYMEGDGGDAPTETEIEYARQRGLLTDLALAARAVVLEWGESGRYRPDLDTAIERLKAQVDRFDAPPRLVGMRRTDVTTTVPQRDLAECDRLRWDAVDALREEHRKAQEQFQKVRALQAEVTRLRHALAFAASVIKSGEPWTSTCEQMIGSALRGGSD